MLQTRWTDATGRRLLLCPEQTNVGGIIDNVERFTRAGNALVDEFARKFFFVCARADRRIIRSLVVTWT